MPGPTNISDLKRSAASADAQRASAITSMSPTQQEWFGSLPKEDRTFITGLDDKDRSRLLSVDTADELSGKLAGARAASTSELVKVAKPKTADSE